MPDEKPPSAAGTSLQAAITPLLVMGLTALAVRWQLDSKTLADNIYAVASALSAIIVAAYNSYLTHVNAQKVQKSETLAPGLTKVDVPAGMEIKVTTAINDPSNNDPPKVITETTTKAQDIPEVKPVKMLKQLLFSVLCMVLMIGGLGGCSNMTPNQRLHAGEVGYIAADVGLTAANAAGKIPEAVKPDIISAMSDFSARLTDAQAWVDANPTLADTPGVSPPSLDALDIVRATVRKYVLKYALFAPLPSTPPATQPASQPVLIPIPG